MKNKREFALWGLAGLWFGVGWASGNDVYASTGAIMAFVMSALKTVK